MIKEIKVSVCFPQNFTIEIEEDDSIDEKIKQIKDHASYLMETFQSDPIIISSDIEELVE